ncbi:MAG: hypothetical protein WCZ23_10855 [Rhodospirillaceae bacterium]
MRLLFAALAGVFLWGTSGPASAQTYSWTTTAPANLIGTWVEMGQSCKDENSPLNIFADGGYQWRRSRTDWGFARGQFSYVSTQPYTIYFRVRQLVAQNKPDFQMALSGDQLRIYSIGSGQERRLERCKD